MRNESMNFFPEKLPEDMDNRIALLDRGLEACTLCPRNCGVNRRNKEKGFCKTGDKAVVASYGPHFGEERPLVGTGGSGTIFFGNCNLGCVFCQNFGISHLGEGQEISIDRLASIMIDLQAQGCHNINLVTPTHQTPMILSALKAAMENGLDIPIVYNCGGYESVKTLELLDGIIDIYMPDFKYANEEMSKRFSGAPDYPVVAGEAVKEMHRQVGDLVINKDGIAVQGLLVRHLVMPGTIAGTAEVLRFIAEEISANTWINMMDQYRPCYKAFDCPEISRKVSASEFRGALKRAVDAGLKRIDALM